MATAIISREDIFKQNLETVAEGDLVLSLFSLAEEFGIAEKIKLEYAFSDVAFEYVDKAMQDCSHIEADKLHTSIMNVYYVVELYLRGFYKKEHYMGYEEFLELIMRGKTRDVVEASHEAFTLHINRLKKIIAKSKKKIPRDNVFFYNTKQLLKELDSNLSICQRYPNTSIKLSEFYFGKMYGECGPTTLRKTTGFLALEETIYSLYNELCVLAKFNSKYIENLCNCYINKIGFHVPFNLFEKVVNNYLFALPYSDYPGNLEISKVDAKLLLKEIKMGTLDSEELIGKLIKKYEFSGYVQNYLIKYGRHIQTRLNNLKNKNYFSELFIVTPPE